MAVACLIGMVVTNLIFRGLTRHEEILVPDSSQNDAVPPNPPRNASGCSGAQLSHA